LFYEINFMTSVALSPKFQVVIPKDVRNALNLVAGQRLDARVVGDHVELVPELPISAIRGMCRGINTDVPNDAEDTDDAGRANARAA
jgi:AbrB family looped-hinge helix DNA binding protein